MTLELVLSRNRAVGPEQKVHFIRHFLNLKASNSRHTAISYERDILDFFQVEAVEQITLEHIIAVNLFDVEHYLLDLRGRGCATGIFRILLEDAQDRTDRRHRDR